MLPLLCCRCYEQQRYGGLSIWVLWTTGCGILVHCQLYGKTLTNEQHQCAPTECHQCTMNGGNAAQEDVHLQDPTLLS